MPDSIAHPLTDELWCGTARNTCCRLSLTSLLLYVCLFSVITIGRVLIRRRLHAVFTVGTFLCSFAIGTVPAAAQSSGLPVLLVHGFCSDSNTWSDMIAALQPSARYGSTVT